MKRIDRISLVFLLTTAAISIPQGIRAGTVQATAGFQFTDAFVTLNGSNFVSLFSQSASSLALLNGSENTGMTSVQSCPGLVSSHSSKNRLLSVSAAEATFNCSPAGIATTSASAVVQLLSGKNESGFATSSYESFTSNFAAGEGDIIGLDSLFSPLLKVEITGFRPGDKKFAKADFQKIFLITENLSNGNTVEVFKSPVSTSISLDNQDGLQTVDPPFPIPVIQNPVIPAQSPGSLGTYQVRFFGMATATATVKRTPEPSAVMGLLGLVGFGILFHRRLG